MNCIECRELLVGYIEGLLDSHQAEAVRLHLNDCAGCRKELEQIKALQNRLVANGAGHGQSDLENAVMDRIVREQAFELRKTKEEKQHLNFWRTFMKNRITQLAAAAVIIIAVTLGVYYFMGSGTKPCMAWDCIIRPIMDANTAEFDIIIGEEGKTPVIHEMVMGSKIRRSIEGMEGAKIIDLGTLRTLALFPQTKTAVYIEPLKERPQIPNYLVQIKDAIKTLQNTPGFVVEELGQKDIDGQISYGFEAKHPKANIVIYVDPATALPVRIEQESGQMKMIYKNMRFDVPIDETLFSMDAPEGYKIEQQKMDMRGSTEEDFIEGLRIQAEVVGDGQFPDDVSVEHFIKMMPTLHEKVGKMQISDEQKTAIGIKLQKGLMFIRFFKGEGKWVYAGKGVKLGDANTAIFWYRPAGSQTYHVIYGDLSVKDVAESGLPRPVDRQKVTINLPFPADGAVSGQLAGLQLSWMPGMYANEHKVYIGTAVNELAPLADVSGDSNMAVPQLQRNTTYYWRVDGIDANGNVTTGDVWSFNTGALVGWWKLDETTGTIAYDASGNGNNGTLLGNPVWQPSGGIRLDGDGDYVEIGNKSQFDITEQITLSAWIQVGEFNKDWQAIFTKGDSSWRLSRGPGNGLHFACSGVTAQTTWVNGTKEVNDGKWHQVTGVYDGKEMWLYVDGVLDVSAPATGKITTNDSPVMIGENAQLRGREWNGLIDDVRIYNYALSEDEIVELYNSSYAAVTQTQ